MSKQMVCVDFGEKYLKLMVGNKGAVSKIIRVPMPENYIRDGKIVSSENMIQFLKPIIKENRLKGSDCALLLSYEDALLRRTTVPSMTRSQLELNLPFEFRAYIKEDMNRYFYDYMLMGKSDVSDNQSGDMDIVAAAVKKECIETYRELLRQAGLKLKIAIPRECAYSNLLRYHIQNGGAREEDYCVVDFGYRSTRVHVFSGAGYEVTRMIDIGGSAIDRAIADRLDIEKSIASDYKETNHNDVQTLECCTDVYRAIALEIMKAINFYGFNKPKSNIRQVYFCGGGANIEPLLKSMEQATGLDGKPLTEILPAGSADTDDLLSGVAAAGAMMQ